MFIICVEVELVGGKSFAEWNVGESVQKIQVAGVLTWYGDVQGINRNEFIHGNIFIEVLGGYFWV